MIGAPRQPTIRAADWRNTALVVILGLLLGGLYFIAIDLQAPTFIFTQQQNVISGVAGSPYRYRVLVPFMLEALARVFEIGHPSSESAFQSASLVYDCVGLVFQMVVLYFWIRQFFPPIVSLLGVTFTAGVTVLTLSYFTYQPWSILEVALFALGFLLAYRQQWVWVGAIVVLASLNRETGVFLPVALFLATLRRQQAWRNPEMRLTFGYVVLSSGIFLGLRLIRGSADPVDRLDEVIVRNLQRNNVIAAASAIPLVLGFGWLYAVFGFRQAPAFLRGIARVVPFYLVAFAIWGWWREVRILTSLYPVLVPLVLVYCCRVGAPTSAPTRSASTTT